MMNFKIYKFWLLVFLINIPSTFYGMYLDVYPQENVNIYVEIIIHHKNEEKTEESFYVLREKDPLLYNDLDPYIYTIYGFEKFIKNQTEISQLTAKIKYYSNENTSLELNYIKSIISYNANQYLKLSDEDIKIILEPICKQENQ